MRPSNRFAILMCLIGLLLAAASGHALHTLLSVEGWRSERQQLVRTLGLTDLCLATEASYTRNPAMADRFVPFQDHPMAFEHFPSGSSITPPSHLVFHAPHH